jgi:hypothetical protein
MLVSYYIYRDDQIAFFPMSETDLGQFFKEGGSKSGVKINGNTGVYSFSAIKKHPKA